jgi:hypothetical protein
MYHYSVMGGLHLIKLMMLMKNALNAQTYGSGLVNHRLDLFDQGIRLDIYIPGDCFLDLVLVNNNSPVSLSIPGTNIL